MRDDTTPDWLPVGEAVRSILGSIDPLGAETCPLREGLGRVLADDLRSAVDLPPWTNSAMDGFAVRAADVAGATASAPVELPVGDDIAAGRFPRGPLEVRTAARVMTGAPLPVGADSVIRVEHTDGGVGFGGDQPRVVIRSDEDCGRNVRLAGEDVRKGEIALPGGALLTPAALGVAASIGRERLPVFRRPVVGLLTSGDELVEVERFAEVLAGRRIVSSNSYVLAAQLAEAGCEVRDLGIAGDTPESLRERLAGAAGCDALVTSAGVSVGEHDYVKAALRAVGAEVRFWRVRMRPGSPMAFGLLRELNGIPWFGLPGNPVSAAVTFELFVRPALLRMGGAARVFPFPLPAYLRGDYIASGGLTHFVRVRLEREPDGALGAHPTGAQGSGVLSSLAAADGLLIVPETQAGARAGERLWVVPMRAPPGTDQPPF